MQSETAAFSKEISQVYKLNGMRCQGCARKLESTLGDMSEKAEIDFPSATVRLLRPTGTLDALNERLAELGAYKLSEAPSNSALKASDAPPAKGLAAYFPLILIAGYLAIGSLANAATASDWMRHFMAGFFLVFSFFKLLNVQGFADSYAMYDLIAARWKGYGVVYPFIELALGAAYLFAWQLQTILCATLFLTIVSGIGVVRSVLQRKTIRCGCLGAILNVPVSTVTLIEDFGMAAMAAAMLATWPSL